MRSLTRRQRQILELLANEALDTRALGNRMGISEKTAKTHLFNACRVIGVSSRVEAAAWTWQNGFIWRDSSDTRRVRFPEPA